MKWHYYVATALYCGLIFFLSSRQDLPDTGNLLPFGDKFAHVLAYGGLAAIVSIGMRRSNERLLPAAQWLVPIAFTVLYGISDELHQWFVPHRSADPWDVVADGVGALLVQWVLCRAWWKIPIRHETIA